MKILSDQRRFMEIEGFGGVPAGFNRAEAEVIAEERFFGDAEFDAKLGHDVDFMAAFGGIISAQKDRIDFFILIQRGGGLDAVAQDAGRFSVQVNASPEDDRGPAGDRFDVFEREAPVAVTDGQQDCGKLEQDDSNVIR